MIGFESLKPEDKQTYESYFRHNPEKGCEYSFANIFMWGRQKVAFFPENIAYFSQFNRKSVYPFPVGSDLKPTLDAIIHDAVQRGIPCRLTGMTPEDCQLLEQLYPGRFRYHTDRDFFDYVYAVEDLAELKGRKYQRKRNHLNRFRQEHPDYTVEPIGADNLDEVRQLVSDWYEKRLAADPTADFHMEKAAIKKALEYGETIGMVGIAIRDSGKLLAMTMGNPLSADTFDVNFEKAIDEGAYPAINWEFARYIQTHYPQIRYLNREDDMGLEGLRKAKLSYCPHHMVEKSWACLLEDGYDY